MKITKAALNALDLSPLSYSPEFTAPAGQEHYRLLTYLSRHLPDGPVFDVGTHLGNSALALASSGRAVFSFDVDDHRAGPVRDAENIFFFPKNLFDSAEREPFEKLILRAPLIFIDIDPHEGKQEFELVSWLASKQYRGLIVLDDIWHFKGMRNNCWYRIEPQYKCDVTHLGHWSGTGFVSFTSASQPAIEGSYHSVDTSNWTLVTGYFDLTNKPDANDALRARPPSYYLDEHSASTMSLDKNLVVFCDPALEDKMWSLRPRFLHDRTRVIPLEFEGFPMSRYRQDIVDIRGNNGACSRDPRNTASYYLFCMARYAMMKQAIDNNLFQSSHFAWINICLEHNGYRNFMFLDEALALHRDKFSTCFIDYTGPEINDDLAGWFGPAGCRDCRARCSMCSGFFTGGASHMYQVCDELERMFLYCLRHGYGHADEQLYPLVYWKHPELFDWYCGDYDSMVTNYSGVKVNPERPIENLIQHAIAAGDMATAKRAAEILLRSSPGVLKDWQRQHLTELVK